jgi:serine phosphatase RsbU (regulator of sigma subunit)
MASSPLRKLLSSMGIETLETLLTELDPTLYIKDSGDQILLGIAQTQDTGGYDPAPIYYENQLAGWLGSRLAPQSQDRVIAFIEYWLARESEKRHLAAEVLDSYRELNLFYRFSEKLAASLEENVIAQTALDEIGPLIKATTGFVALEKPKSGLNTVARFGRSCNDEYWLENAGELIHRVLSTGMAELSSQLVARVGDAEPYAVHVSLLCAPLKTEKRILGMVFMATEGTRQFTAGDLKLVTAVALQTAPVMEIALLHQLELEKARLERDLHTARRVQAGLLPQVMPELEGWNIAALWKPARMVSGDLYDFLPFRNGKLGIVIADVTDKGVPAALLMANTRSVLRAVVQVANRNQLQSPGKLLGKVNRILHGEMPLGMFVTCLLMVLDPATGTVSFANAGHNLPYHRTSQAVRELRAVGVPLGIFANSSYEDHEFTMQPGDSLLLYSDGLPEAHNPAGEMFDYDRLSSLLAYPDSSPPLLGNDLLEQLMESLALFTGSPWEQEDDVTLVTLARDGAGN